MQGLVAGRPVPLTDGRQLRDFIYVEDATAALVELLFRPVSGPVNIANGSAMSLKAMAEAIGHLTGRPDLLRFDARPRPDRDPDRLVAEIHRLRTEAQFLPRFDLDAGLARTLAFWRNRLTGAAAPAMAS
jgi:nucleoside-diphosphate-sugar epimerase